MQRVINTREDLDRLVEDLRKKRLPLSVKVESNRHRTIEQNKLQRLWCMEVADHFGDRTPEEVRGDAKLRFGVPILRAEDEAFCAAYDSTVKPLPYEMKLALMMEPLDWAVTRKMNTSQKTRYLEALERHYRAEGVALTVPKEREAA